MHPLSSALIATLALSADPPSVKVRGIALAANGRAAVILTDGLRERAVVSGDMAFGCLVGAATQTSVMLECEGSKRELRLEAKPALIASAPPDETRPTVTTENPEEMKIERAALEARLGREMQRLMTETTLIPVTSRGLVSGFTLSRIPSGTILEELGLRAGDVLTEVNGTAVDGFPTLIGLWPRLQKEGSVRAQVLRDGKPVELSVSIK